MKIDYSKIDPEKEDTGYCGGMKGCHKSERTFDEETKECQLCVKDMEDAMAWADTYFR